MKKLLYIIAAAALCVGSANAQKVQKVTMQRDKENVGVSIDVDLKDMKLNTNSVMLLEPKLVCGADTIALPGASIFGKERYIYYERNGLKALNGPHDKTIQYKNRPNVLHIKAVVPYQEKLESSKIIMVTSTYGCCKRLQKTATEVIYDCATSPLTSVTPTTPIAPVKK